MPTQFSIIGCSLGDGNQRAGSTKWSSFKGSLMAIAFLGQSTHEYIGSGVMVAPGIVISARHIFDEKRSELFASELTFVACSPQGSMLEFWRPYSVIEIGRTDLIVLSMDYAGPLTYNHRFHGMRLSTRTPVIGEWVTIAGFRPTGIEFNYDTDGKAVFGGGAYCCAGEVTQIYTDRRDRVMLPWPVFEINCSAYGAMSGGAVIDRTGCVIGLLSSSVAGSESGPAYASFLWELLDTPLSGGWRGLEFLSHQTTLRELANNERGCSIVKPEAVSTHRKTESGFAHCEPWLDESAREA